jgi:undecaprenyl-diphosphatase
MVFDTSFDHMVLYALVQGLGEFLPVSSSAHLWILQTLSGWPSPGFFMDVTLHAGSLFTILIFFRQDVADLLKGALRFLRKEPSKETQLFTTLCVATIPVVVVGAVVEAIGRAYLVTLGVMGITSFVGGALLFWADKRPLESKKPTQMGLSEAFWGWGLFQCLALIPGMSRLGMTLTFGRLAEYRRFDAARFSFLLAIPTLVAALTLKGIQLLRISSLGYAEMTPLLWAVLLSAAVGYVVLFFFMWWVRYFTLRAFALYRIILGTVILIFYWMH